MSTSDPYLALFEPRGIVVAGASTHPGKFGFVSLHNLLSNGYAGKVFGTNLKGENVLGVEIFDEIGVPVLDIGEQPDDLREFKATEFVEALFL